MGKASPKKKNESWAYRLEVYGTQTLAKFSRHLSKILTAPKANGNRKIRSSYFLQIAVALTNKNIKEKKSCKVQQCDNLIKIKLE